MEKKVTEKQIFIGGLLVKVFEKTGKGATCYQILKDFKKDLEEKKIDTTKINSVNATLASLATKELVTKTKVAYNDKMVTLYTLNEKGLEFFKNLLNKDTKEEN